MENTIQTSRSQIANSAPPETPSNSDESETKLDFSSSEDPQCAYLLAEVSIFNNRVIWYLEQQQKQELFALGASGVLWAYLLKGEGDIFNIWVALTPPVISGVLLAKSVVMTKAMIESMDYLEKLENSFKLKNSLGWVHFYKQNTSNYKRKWRSYFWKGLLAINIFICCAYISTHVKDIEKQNAIDKNIALSAKQNSNKAQNISGNDNPPKATESVQTIENHTSEILPKLNKRAPTEDQRVDTQVSPVNREKD